MKVVVSILFFISSFFAKNIDNSFITKFEYGQMLYENPRGVGCIKCHKQVNEDIIIARYKQKDKKTKKLVDKSIIAPSIDKVSYEVFLKKMTQGKTESKVMPTYFLTNEELESLYYYIKNKNKR